MRGARRGAIASSVRPMFEHGVTRDQAGTSRVRESRLHRAHGNGLGALLPALAMHNVVERSATRSRDWGERSIGRVSEGNEQGKSLPLWETEHPGRQVLVDYPGVGAADAHPGGGA